MKGRIHKIAGNTYEVRTEIGVLQCRFRGRMKLERGPARNLVVVGDEVDVDPQADAEGVIQRVLPRRSKLSRHDVMNPSVEQVLVANPDIMVILQAADDPPFLSLVMDKCTVMAAANHLPCVVCVNKSDLGTPDLSPYEKGGFACVRVSAKTGQGLDALGAILKGRVSVFLGPSGVGKSSLLNALEPGLSLKVGEVSRRGEGRHTTTWSELVPVAGGWVADTPGLESFTLIGVTPENLKDHFLDFVDLAEGCRFRNCSHMTDDGCAVRAKADPSRLRNYLILREQLLRERSISRQ